MNTVNEPPYKQKKIAWINAKIAWKRRSVSTNVMPLIDIGFVFIPCVVH